MWGFGYTSETLAFLELCSCTLLPFAFTLLGKFSNTEKWDECVLLPQTAVTWDHLSPLCPHPDTTRHVTQPQADSPRGCVCVSLCASGTGLTSSRFPCDLLWPVGYLR